MPAEQYLFCNIVPEHSKVQVFAAFIRKQVGMGALLNHAAAVKHGDLITEFAGGEAVADVNRSLITCNFIEF